MINDVENFNVLTSEVERIERSTLCNSCENNINIQDIDTCYKCACPIEYVVTYKFKECPIKKWVIE